MVIQCKINVEVNVKSNKWLNQINGSKKVCQLVHRYLLSSLSTDVPLLCRHTNARKRVDRTWTIQLVVYHMIKLLNPTQEHHVHAGERAHTHSSRLSINSLVLLCYPCHQLPSLFPSLRAQNTSSFPSKTLACLIVFVLWWRSH